LQHLDHQGVELLRPGGRRRQRRGQQRPAQATAASIPSADAIATHAGSLRRGGPHPAGMCRQPGGAARRAGERRIRAVAVARAGTIGRTSGWPDGDDVISLGAPPPSAGRLRLQFAAMRTVRVCSRSGCGLPAVATLTYAYSDSTAVVGPLATASEPHSYDLCAEHAMRLTAPRGWEVVRHEGDF